MKAKKVLAVLTSAVFMASATAALAACGKDEEPVLPQELGTTTLNVADYAVDYAKVYEESGATVNNGYTSAKELVKLKTDDMSGYGYQSNDYSLFTVKVAGATAADTTYKVYSLPHEKYILTGLSAKPTYRYSSLGYGSTVNYIEIAHVNPEDGTTYSYVAEDGTELLPAGSYYNISFNKIERYVGSDTEKSDILVVNARDEDYDTITKLFKMTVSNSGAVSYSAVVASDLKLSLDDYSVGTDLSGKNPVYDVDSDHKVTGDIADYEMLRLGKTYNFYKNDQKTGSVQIENGSAVGVVGNYMYYYNVTPVSPDATDGYNFYSDDLKGNYTLYRYDIVADTSEALNYNVCVTRITPMYNSTAKAYDAAVVSCIKMTDGVFYMEQSTVKSFVTDANLAVAYDVTGVAAAASSFNGVIYKFDDNVFAINNVLVDKDLQYISKVGNGDSLSFNEKLVKFTVNGKVGFKGFDGKVVVEPKYTNLSEFYGGVASATEELADGTTKKVLINKNGTVKELPDNSNTVTVDVKHGIYTVITEVKGADDAPSTYNFEVFNFAGSSLKKITGLQSQYYAGVQYINGSYYISEMTTSEGTQFGTIYKLV